MPTRTCLAGKVRLGGLGGDQPDEIRRYNADGSFVVLAVDDDSDPLSPFTGFDNGIGLSPDGRAAFVANTATGRGVYLADGSAITTIATTDDAEISGIDFFGPAVNGNGWVAFRAFDAAGLRAIYVGDGIELRRVVGEHDLVPTDLGEGRIDQHDTSPVFGGSVDINASGDDALDTGAGDDLALGGGGNDALAGDDGNDVLLDRELRNLSETAIRFSHALLVMRGGIRQLRQAIQEGRGA